MRIKQTINPQGCCSPTLLTWLECHPLLFLSHCPTRRHAQQAGPQDC
jgi:hypothetical protein